MKRITIKIGVITSVIIMIIGLFVELSNSSIIGGSVSASKFNREQVDVNLSGITIIIIGITLLILTYMTYRDLKK